MERVEQAPQSGPQNTELAALLSLVIPGLGQMYAGRGQRGRWILITTIVLLGLTWWLDLWMLAPLFIPFWAWNVWEARAIAQGERPSTVKLLITIALIVYAIGWQVTQIDINRFVTGATRIRPFVTGLLQPNFVTRDITWTQTRTGIQVPCGESPSLQTPAEGPRVIPTQNCAAVGESITFQGRGFPPNVEGQLWWINPIGDRARLRVGREFVDFQTGDHGTFDVQVTVPDVAPEEAGSQIHRVEARYVTDVGPLELSETGGLVIEKMGVTIALALMATTFGALFAIPVSFFAARNLMQINPLSMTVYYIMRGFLNILRSIEPLIMAIVFVVWVGLGPFAGVLALTMHSIAALGKLYSESIEGIKPGPIEAITAAGGNRWQVIWYGVLPQVLPPFTAFTVYRWDINVRMSTIIGFVGGGGIGFLLQQWIRLTDFQSAGAAIWAIGFVVAILDYGSRKLRERIV